jgi:nucleotide-binding universal stress UspA family protein
MVELLVPVDGSKPAERAVRHAIRLVAGGLKAQVLLLNVQPELPRSRSRADKRSDVLQQLEEADEAMRSAETLLERAGATWERCLRSGAPADTILALARERHCAAIVMGTRGLGAVAGLVLGSVAAKIVQLAPVPVTLVK